jgi:hypothetical protein
MTDRQEDFISMVRTLLAIRLLYAADIAALADLDADFDDLKTEGDAIKLLLPKQKLQTTGVARDKHDMETELVTEAVVIAGAVMAFASKAGNNTLFQEVNYSKSKLEGIRDTELSDTCRIVHDRANTNLLALAGRGITAGVLTDFMTLITDYENMDQAPRTATVQKSTATVGMSTHFTISRKIITERLDGGMRYFINNNPEIYTAYKSARKIVNTGRRKENKIASGELIFVVKDASNNPLEHVLVSTGEHLSSTDGDGNGKLKGIAPGNISVRFFLTNFGELFQNATIINGQETHITINLPANLGKISGAVNFVTGTGPATISVQGTPLTTTTDSSDNYTVNNVPVGTYNIVAVKVSDSATQTQPTTVNPAGSSIVDFNFA